MKCRIMEERETRSVGRAERAPSWMTPSSDHRNKNPLHIVSLQHHHNFVFSCYVKKIEDILQYNIIITQGG